MVPYLDQADLANFSIARLNRAVSGAMTCSVNFSEASVSLPDSAIAFSIVDRARLACRSKASFSDLADDNALNVDIVSSNDAWALAAICLPMSWTPAVQIW